MKARDGGVTRGMASMADGPSNSVGTPQKLQWTWPKNPATPEEAVVESEEEEDVDAEGRSPVSRKLNMEESLRAGRQQDVKREVRPREESESPQRRLAPGAGKMDVEDSRRGLADMSIDDNRSREEERSPNERSSRSPRDSRPARDPAMLRWQEPLATSNSTLGKKFRNGMKRAQELGIPVVVSGLPQTRPLMSDQGVEKVKMGTKYAGHPNDTAYFFTTLVKKVVKAANGDKCLTVEEGLLATQAAMNNVVAGSSADRFWKAMEQNQKLMSSEWGDWNRLVALTLMEYNAEVNMSVLQEACARLFQGERESAVAYSERLRVASTGLTGEYKTDELARKARDGLRPGMVHNNVTSELMHRQKEGTPATFDDTIESSKFYGIEEDRQAALRAGGQSKVERRAKEQTGASGQQQQQSSPRKRPNGRWTKSEFSQQPAASMLQVNASTPPQYQQPRQQQQQQPRQQQQQQQRNTTPGTGSPRKENRECYTCRRAGHVARDCPDRPAGQ